MDIRIITEHFNETLESSKLLVNSLVTDYIRQDALRGGRCIDFARQYISYMSLLSRLLLRYIKKHKLQEFDLAILSNQIDDGMWSTSDEVSHNI